jgi:hypothetical protein
MFEAKKTNLFRGDIFAETFLRGKVLDIGAGADLVCSHAQAFDLKHGDANYVDDYFDGHITVDIVAQPSAPGAYPTPVYENLMNSRGGSRAFRVAQEVQQDPKAQKYLREAMLNIINGLK